MHRILLCLAVTSLLAAIAAGNSPPAAAESVAPANLAALLSANTTPQDAAKTTSRSSIW